MGRPLVQGLLYILVTLDARLLDGVPGQQVLLGFCMVLAMAGQTTHAISVVLAALPGKGVSILRVALKTRAIRVRRCHLGRILNILGLSASDVLFGIAVTGLAGSSP